MKKLYYLIILTVILSLVLTGCFLSNVGQVPTTGQSGMTYLTRNGEGPIILYAGQNIPVGTVEVSNDGDNLYVTYLIDAPGWYLTETHLHVACSESKIPQNKKGNPKPGQFDFKTEHEYFEEITEEPFVISLDDIGCCSPVIAAHAVVCKLGEVQEPTLVSNNKTMTAGWTDEDPESAPLNPVMYGDTWVNAIDLSSPNPGWYLENTGSFLGAYWISTYNGLEGLVGENSWRLFKEDFNIPSEAVNISATLHMAADNALKAYLNGELVGGTDSVFLSETYPGDIGSQPYYFNADQGPFYPDLKVGDNTLAFVVRNWFGSESNPVGLLYKLDYSYQLLECETAWGDGDRFVEANDPDDPGVHGGGNWATYFEYEIQPVCPGITSLSESIDVLDYIPSDVSVGAFENNNNIRVWKEFEGPLPENLQYDLDDGDVATDGVPSGHPYSIDAGTDVCIFYVHFDSEGESGVEQIGSLIFGADILGVIISGGSLGDFAGENLMFAADNQIGHEDTTYPLTSGNDYLRGYDVNAPGNSDNVLFSGNKVDFTTWVKQAHDSFRVIVPMVQPCE